MIAAATKATTTSGFSGPTLAVGILTASVALFTLAVNQIRARKDRQRELFGDAFATVTEYREYPFIVRRRDGAGSDRQSITTELSAVQARLNHYTARLRVEAPRVDRAYQRLVADTRRVAGAEISRSWEIDPRKAGVPVHVRDVDLSELEASDESFLREVRDELAVLPGALRRPARALGQRISRRRSSEPAAAPTDPRAEPPQVGQ